MTGKQKAGVIMEKNNVKDWFAFLILVLLLVVAFNTRAHEETGNLSGIYYDSTREGEGIFVLHDQVFGILSFGMFTHDPSEAFEDCETIPAVYNSDNLLLREEFEHCLSVVADRTSSWFIAADPWHGSSSGIVYECEAYNYPITIAQRLCESRAVGMYILDYTEDGFRLIITPTGGGAPDTLYNWYWFNTKLLGAR